MDLKYSTAAFVVSIALIGCEQNYENDRDTTLTNRPSVAPSAPASTNLTNTNLPPQVNPPRANPPAAQP